MNILEQFQLRLKKTQEKASYFLGLLFSGFCKSSLKIHQFNPNLFDFYKRVYPNELYTTNTFLFQEIVIIQHTKFQIKIELKLE